MGELLDILEKLGVSTVGLKLPDKEETEEFFKNLSFLELKLSDCNYGYTIGEVSKLARSDQEFPVKEKCECLKLYNEIKKCDEEFKEKYNII